MNYKTFYKEEGLFSREEFISPPQRCAPVYNWVWNGPVSKEETDRQLDEMQRLGIRSFCIVPEPKSFRPNHIPTMLEPDYLTCHYFEEYKYAIESAKKRKMHTWLYDEGGWPSGGACGKVMYKNPALAASKLDKKTREIKAGEVYEQTEDVISAYLKDGNKVQNGESFDKDVEIDEYYIEDTPFLRPGFPEHPDLTRKETTITFLKETHEGYKKYMEEFFGDIMLTVFSDEPFGPRDIPFRKELKEQFEKENGYSILPYIKELFGDKGPSDEAAKARIAWYDMCSRLFCENYLLTEKKWTNEHNMGFIGHMDVEHHSYLNCLTSGNYNLMRSLRCFDMPGIDVIWRQIFPYQIYNPFKLQKGDGNGIFPRYASSAAAQVGTKYAITESLGVYGAGVTFNEMRYVLNFQAVRGINVYNIFGVPYAREGFLMMGELPYFLEKFACYADLKEFNIYVERLSYLASLGKSINDTAYYFPICDLVAGQKSEEISDTFEDIGNKLEDERILFDIIDDDVFEKADKAELKTGRIVMGNAVYTSVVIPPCKFMPEKTKAALEEFISGGGKVIVIEGTETADIKGAIKTDSLSGKLKAPLELSGDKEKIRLGARETENGRLYLLFNEANEEKSFFVKLDSDVYILDAENGRIFVPDKKDGLINLTLVSGQMAFLWQGSCVKAEEKEAFENEKELTDFLFKRKSRFVIGYMNFETEEICEEEKKIELGDWENVTGVDFSGSGVYKTTFELTGEKDKICLDLGAVFSSAEVYLNGESLGIKVMAPYRYIIPKALLKEKNNLEIRVSNTAANEYLHTKSFDKWQPWQLTSYINHQTIFHKDSLKSGLYGPVKILY